jgi:hypothetical protein
LLLSLKRMPVYGTSCPSLRAVGGVMTVLRPVHGLKHK